MGTIGRLVLRECSVLGVLSLAGALWFALLYWFVPQGYELIARYGAENFSYLWDNSAQRIQDSASWGPIFLGIFYVALQVARLTGWLSSFVVFWRRKPAVRPALEHGASEPWTPGRILGYCLLEAIIAGTIVLSGSVALHFSHQAYQNVRKVYFFEVVMTGAKFRALPPSAKVRAQAQYEAMSPDDPVAAMFNEYGFKAKAPFHCQRGAWWLIIWGYPVLLLVRAIRWTVIKLHHEPS